MGCQGLELSSLCQLSLGLSFLKSCLFDRILALSLQICEFSLLTRLEKKAPLSPLRFVEGFSSLYLGSKGQGTSVAWINRLVAGDHRVAAASERSPSHRCRCCASVLYRNAVQTLIVIYIFLV